MVKSITSGANRWLVELVRERRLLVGVELHYCCCRPKEGFCRIGQGFPADFIRTRMGWGDFLGYGRIGRTQNQTENKQEEKSQWNPPCR